MLDASGLPEDQYPAAIEVSVPDVGFARAMEVQLDVRSIVDERATTYDGYTGQPIGPGETGQGMISTPLVFAFTARDADGLPLNHPEVSRPRVELSNSTTAAAASAPTPPDAAC